MAQKNYRVHTFGPGNSVIMLSDASHVRRCFLLLRVDEHVVYSADSLRKIVLAYADDYVELA